VSFYLELDTTNQANSIADNSAQQYRGGAIPLCMVNEFYLSQSIIDRQVRKMKIISPSNNLAIEFGTVAINVNCVAGL
jgi:hypothetical protein